MNWQEENGRIWATDDTGRLLAEVTFPETAENTVEINHTFVDESLRGQGIAAQLLQRAADRIRRDGKRAVPTCSYALKWFEQHPQQADLLSKNFEI